MLLSPLQGQRTFSCRSLNKLSFFVFLPACPFSRQQEKKRVNNEVSFLQTSWKYFIKKENVPIHLLDCLYTVAKNGLTSVLLGKTSWDPFFVDITWWGSSVVKWLLVWSLIPCAFSSVLLLCRRWKQSCPWMLYCRWQALRWETRCEDSAPAQRNVPG